MSESVWKYQLEMATNRIELPVGAEVLCAKMQHGVLSLWAKVYTTSAKETRVFEVVGTGHTMRDGKTTYIDTVMLSEGHLVFHIFERH